MNFTPGINAIRAANEAGKSTALKAIAYAMFGSKALPETLEDTVTYGVPVSKLKVTLDFDHAGVAYSISRGKSGAELVTSGAVVTGQTEVTKYVERLLGTSADKRDPQFPEVPTIAESGVPGYEATGWYGVLAPAGTPLDVVSKLNAAVVAALKDSDVAERIRTIGMEPAPTTSAGH